VIVDKQYLVDIVKTMQNYRNKILVPTFYRGAFWDSMSVSTKMWCFLEF